MQATMRRYLDDVQPLYGGAPEDEDDDGGNDNEAPPEVQETQANAATMANAPGNYLAPPVDPSASPTIPGMIGVSPDDIQQPLPINGGGNPIAISANIPPAPPPTLWQKMRQAAFGHDNLPPVSSVPPQNYPEAAKAFAKIYDQFPQRQAPNWVERIAAGALGGAAGWSNAARRAAPIDIQKATEPILYPGYDSKLAQWQSRVIPAQQALETAGAQYSAQLKGAQTAAEVGVKQAQVGYYQQRGQYYGSLNPSRLVPVDQELSEASGGVYRVGQQIPASAASKVIDDAIKATRPMTLRPGETVFDPRSKTPVYTNPNTTVRQPAPNAALLGIRATGAITGNPQVDAMNPADAKKAIELGKDHNPVVDELARQRLEDAEGKRNTDLDTSKINGEKQIMQNLEQRISGANNITNRPTGYDPATEIQRARAEAQQALQNVQDRYARTIRQRGGAASDYTVTFDQRGLPVYTQKGEPYGMVAAAAPTTPTFRPTPTAALPQAPTGSPAQGVRVTLPGGKVKVFPNQAAADAFAREAGLQ